MAKKYREKHCNEVEAVQEEQCSYLSPYSLFIMEPDKDVMDNGMIMFPEPTIEEREILRNAYDYFQQRIRCHSKYYKDGMVYKFEEMFGCVVKSLIKCAACLISPRVI